MFACKALVRASLPTLVVVPGTIASARPERPLSALRPPPRSCVPLLCSGSHESRSLPYSSTSEAAADPLHEVSSGDMVEELLAKADGIKGLMKMERRADAEREGETGSRWFPYLNIFRSGSASLTSREVVEVLGPYILESRKERMKKAVGGRSYAICLVVEGLTDFGNVSAAFRSADALGIQSVHVISNDKSKRCCRV